MELLLPDLLPLAIIIERSLRNNKLIAILIIVENTVGKKTDQDPEEPTRITDHIVNLAHLPHVLTVEARHVDVDVPIDLLAQERFLNLDVDVLDDGLGDEVAFFDQVVLDQGDETTLGLNGVGAEIEYQSFSGGQRILKEMIQ